MSNLLSREQILTVQDIKTQIVDCPEWGGSVTIRALTLAEYDSWRRGLLKRVENRKNGAVEVTYEFDRENGTQNEIRLIVFGCVDADGKQLFTEADVNALMKRHATPLKRLAKAIQKLSGGTDEDIADAEKN